ncbi:thiol:disulfide interchange protein DsbA/DsbL [Luteimonas gilva]|uniref:Thiol:disulfide interchange protein DsbA n=1 Tax=Luteimonas gilva TaxID=2572684 RepID=A0A4U5JMB9_9GAMM|nr:thiol:disulfide interchange protein DsbA/DsbL [Luteimonas gilva]TKR29388.1 thiol:disulfide interchange protein DsbA/DsbL [Luteimonas gilva]
MVQRLALLLLALLPLAACDRPSASAPAASESLVAAKSAGPVAGVDYIEIPGGQPYAPQAGKVEIAEAFGYPCPHCAHFEPLLIEWKEKLPANANFVAVPAAFGGPWDTFARAYFAAEAAGLAEKTHVPMFSAIHAERRLPPNAAPERIAAFYAEFGADPDAFLKSMNSPEVEAKFKHARDFLARTEVQGAAQIGTPMMIVAGKYRVDASSEGGYEKMLDTVGKLVARESKPAR